MLGFGDVESDLSWTIASVVTAQTRTCIVSCGHHPRHAVKIVLARLSALQRTKTIPKRRVLKAILRSLRRITHLGGRQDHLEPDDSAAHADGDSFGSIISPELLQDVLDMALHGFLADEEHRGDVAVAIASGDLLENFDLSAA